MRTPHRPLADIAVLACLLAVLAAAPAIAGASESKDAKLRIDVRSEDGEGVHLTFGSGFVSGLVSTLAPSHMDCDANADEPEVRRFFRELDRAGDGAKGTLEHEGDLLEARRVHGQLRLKVTDEDGDVSRMNIPWPLARCLFAGEDLSRAELLRALEAGDLSIEVDDRDDSVSIDIR
jgi:citrate lyase gamma subunit